MASSGNFSTTAYSGFSLKFAWTEASQNVANNTTTISWKLSGVGGSGFMKTRNVKVVIGGETVYYQGEGTESNYIELYNGTVVASGTYTLKHDDNGEKKFTASVEGGIYNWDVNCTGSGTFTLNTIPRKSTLAASNGTLGTAQTLTVTRKSTEFTHTITYKCGSNSGTVCTKSSSTSISWTPPIDLAAAAPSANSVAVTFTIETFSGNTSVGSETVSITCTIPNTDTFVPVLMPATSDAMGYSSTYGALVQGQSKLKVDITAYGVYGAWITEVKTTFDGKTYTAADTVTTDVIKASGQQTLTVKVTDSRGRTSTSTASFTVLPYEYPKITALTATRCNADGTLNPSGSYLLAKFSATVSALNNKNTAKYYVGYKKVTEESHTAVELTALSGKYSVTNGTYVIPAETDSSYTVIFTAVDAFQQARTVTTGSPVKKVVSMLKKNGEIVGMAFNKVAEHEGYFDIGWPVKFSGGGDTVIEQGEKDGWTYRKWDSGVAECWKISEFSTTINTAFGSLYCGNAFARVSYPFTFKEKPVENVTLQSSSTQAILYCEASGYGVNGTSASARYNVFKPSAVTTEQTFYLSFHVIGKWK